jgi:hypothetical protein
VSARREGGKRWLGGCPLVRGHETGQGWVHIGDPGKKFHVIEGSNHMPLYDVPKYVDEAVSVLAPFFKANL